MQYSLYCLVSIIQFPNSNIVYFLPNSIPWQVQITYIKSDDSGLKNDLLRVKGPGKERINFKASF